MSNRKPPLTEKKDSGCFFTFRPFLEAEVHTRGFRPTWRAVRPRQIVHFCGSEIKMLVLFLQKMDQQRDFKRTESKKECENNRPNICTAKRPGSRAVVT